MLLKDSLFYKPYCVARENARRRGIAFKFTFVQWVKLWEDSGHWSARGRGKDKYCMARLGDKGPYAVGNVKIITGKENSAEQRPVKHSKSTKAKISEAKKQLWLDSKYRAKHSAINKQLWLDPVYRATLDQALSDPGYRAKRSELIRRAWADGKYDNRNNHR